MFAMPTSWVQGGDQQGCTAATQLAATESWESIRAKSEPTFAAACVKDVSETQCQTTLHKSELTEVSAIHALFTMSSQHVMCMMEADCTVAQQHRLGSNFSADNVLRTNNHLASLTESKLEEYCDKLKAATSDDYQVIVELFGNAGVALTRAALHSGAPLPEKHLRQTSSIPFADPSKAKPSKTLSAVTHTQPKAPVTTSPFPATGSQPTQAASLHADAPAVQSDVLRPQTEIMPAAEPVQAAHSMPACSSVTQLPVAEQTSVQTVLQQHPASPSAVKQQAGLVLPHSQEQHAAAAAGPQQHAVAAAGTATVVGQAATHSNQAGGPQLSEVCPPSVVYLSL